MWHPFYELPEEEDIYLIAWLRDDCKCPYPHFYEMAEFTDGEWHFERIEKKCDDFTVLAWHELPEFYNEEDE